MSTHRLFVANGQYPLFTGSPSFGPRAKPIAQAVGDEGCDAATFNEMGFYQCQQLAEHLSFQYDRSHGSGPPGHLNEGLNSVWSNPKVFHQPEARLHDWNLNSYGQWQRTALFARLEEVADPTAYTGVMAFHWAAKGAPLNSWAQADRAKFMQVKQTRKDVGVRRSIWAGDFPRTLSDDDERWLRSQGIKIWGRTSSTPLCAMTQGAVHVISVVERPHCGLFDHNYKVVEFSITGDQEKP